MTLAASPFLATSTRLIPADIDARLLDRRVREWSESFGDLDPCRAWLLRDACVQSFRLERAEVEEDAIRSRFKRRAATAWDDDRRLGVEAIAAGLAKKPALIAERLKSGRHGCLWMIERWKALDAANASTGWDASQRPMALDLLGIPEAFRDGPTPVDPAGVGDPRADRAAVVEREVRELRGRIETSLDAIDRQDRRAAETTGAGVEDDPAMKSLRRHINDCRRRFEWCWARIKDGLKPTQAAHAEPEDIEEEPDPVDRELNASLAAFDPEDEATSLRVDDAMTAYLQQAARERLAIPSIPTPAPVPAGNRHARRAAKALARRGR